MVGEKRDTVMLKLMGLKTLVGNRNKQVYMANLDQSWYDFLVGTCGLKIPNGQEVRVRTKHPATMCKASGLRWGWTAGLNERVAAFVNKYERRKKQFTVYLCTTTDGRKNKRAPSRIEAEAIIRKPADVGPKSKPRKNTGEDTRETYQKPRYSPAFGRTWGKTNSRSIYYGTRASKRFAETEVSEDQFSATPASYLNGAEQVGAPALEESGGDVPLQIDSVFSLQPQVKNEEEDIGLHAGEDQPAEQSPLHALLERNMDRFSNGFLQRAQKEIQNMVGGEGWTRNELRAPIACHFLQQIFKVTIKTNNPTPTI